MNCTESTPILENQLETKMENEMETGDWKNFGSSSY